MVSKEIDRILGYDYAVVRLQHRRWSGKLKRDERRSASRNIGRALGKFNE
jgi:hypothetical protein